MDNMTCAKIPQKCCSGHDLTSPGNFEDHVELKTAVNSCNQPSGGWAPSEPDAWVQSWIKGNCFVASDSK